jgi:hypothetical protein
VTFQEWIEKLHADGNLMCPGSSAVPVELAGVRPDGTGFHFRCRGVRVRLALYRRGRASWQLPVWDDRWSPEEGLSLWEHRPVETPSGVPAPAGVWGMAAGPEGAVAGRPGGMGAGTARLVFDDPARPDRVAVVDGAAEWGWTSHEAGLLDATAAAVLFDRLTAEVDGLAGRRTSPGRRMEADIPGDDPDAPGDTVHAGISVVVPYARSRRPAPAAPAEHGFALASRTR